MDIKRRDFLRTAGFSGVALGTGAAGIGVSGQAHAASAPPRRPRVLLKGGYIVTMDPKLGELRGDVLIDNGKIAAVAPGLTAGNADVIDARDMVILPGFIDSHRHAWQSAVR